MNLILLFVFLLCNLIVVSVCRYSFGKQTEYREGMILGVHIPPEYIHDPEAEEICKKQEKNWKLFQRINLAAGLLLCFLCLWDFIIFMVVWTLWIVEYVAGTYYLVIVPHRRMYRLKLRRGWVRENSRHLVRVDTSVSTVAEKLAVSWKWHLPPLILTAATILAGPYIRQRWGTAPAEEMVFWIMYASGAGVCILFLALHLGIAGQANRVYSEDSHVNLAVNRVTKRAWTEGLAGASWMNAAAWIFMTAVYVLAGLDLPAWGYAVYLLLLTLAAAVLLIPVLRSVGKRRRILESDQKLYFTDDDEYWKNGWYNNPNDRHILVQDRLNSMNYAFNYGRPGVKWFVGGLYVLLILSVPAVLIWTMGMLNNFENADVTLEESHDAYVFEAAGYKCEFDQNEILSVNLMGEMPEDRYTRTNGGSTDKVNIGHFRGKETGKCMMFLYNGYSPILEVKLTDGTSVYANSRDPREVEEWYGTLKGNI